MKKIILAATVAAALSTSVMAFDLVDKDENVFIQTGFDVMGAQNDAEDIKWSSTGNPCSAGSCGKYGTDRDASYELAVGLEEETEDFKFGTRKILSLYNHGNEKFHNGNNYITDIENKGIELSYEVFYKVTKYFKPSIGAGIGLNQRKYQTAGTDTENESFRDETNYEPTVNISVGATGEMLVGIGWYINYKYRFADNVTTQVPTKHYEGGTVGTLRPVKWVPFEQKGVSGDQLMAGISYKF